jgi:hypothetical protein
MSNESFQKLSRRGFLTSVSVAAAGVAIPGSLRQPAGGWHYAASSER